MKKARLVWAFLNLSKTIGVNKRPISDSITDHPRSLLVIYGLLFPKVQYILTAFSSSLSMKKRTQESGMATFGYGRVSIKEQTTENQKQEIERAGYQVGY